MLGPGLFVSDDAIAMFRRLVFSFVILLGVLTALHNYWVKRADGTTAAERFFGSKPDDLLEWLLEGLEMPARPARRRSQAA